MIKLLKDFRTYIGLVIFLGIVLTVILGYVELPKKVTVLAQEIDDTEDQVQKVANTLDKYIAVQQTKEAMEENQKELLLRLLESMTIKVKENESNDDE